MKVVCKRKEHISHSTECTIENVCCRKMKKVFNEKYKCSFSDGSGRWVNGWKISECGIEIPIRETVGGFYGSRSFIAYEKIYYCPFCGKEME